jgi:hypothetical protein
MEPITTTILAALAAGAAAAAKDTAGAAIKDGYQGLKALIQRRFAGKPKADLVLAEHEKEPDTWAKPLEKALTEAEADKDEEIVRRAQGLLELLQRSGAGGIQVVGSGAAASHGGVATGQGGNAAGRDVNIRARGQ